MLLTLRLAGEWEVGSPWMHGELIACERSGPRFERFGANRAMEPERRRPCGDPLVPDIEDSLAGARG